MGLFSIILFIVVIITPLLKLGIIKTTAYASDSVDGYTEVGSSSTFWWPVGSNETTTQNGKLFATGKPTVTNITSEYGGRVLEDGTQSFHRGLDIAQDQQVNYYNVIASANGKVYEVNDSCPTYGSLSSYCGGGFGNYVVVDHGNDVYTIYAHMALSSIKVSKGDSVIQGQVLGKIGSSGHSSGPHLHFQIDVGGYGESKSVDPLTYISAKNPRPVETKSDDKKLINFISGEEGGPKNSSKTKYVVYCNPGDPPTVGRGITLEYNTSLFEKYGIKLNSPYSQYCGKEMDIEILDKMFLERIQKDVDAVKKELKNNNINNFKTNQIDALTSLHYNTGNLDEFVDAYKKYGSTDQLCTNWWQTHYINKGTIYEAGLKARRTRECNLFVHGTY